MSSNPFEYLNSINYTKQDIMDPLEESKYPAFMVLRGLSYFADTVVLANEMNKSHHLDPRLQYDFLRHTVRKRKRFSKWTKKERSDKIDVIKEYYNYSTPKAESISDLISDAQVEEMMQKLSKGGKG